MRNKRLARVVRAVERRFPGTKVVVERWDYPEIEVKWWISILNCPVSRLAEADAFATRLSMKLYDWKPCPWGISSVSPRTTREYFSDRLAPDARPKSHSAPRRVRPRKATRRARA